MFALCPPSMALPTSSHVGGSYDIRERTMRLLSETKGVSASNAVSVQGPSLFNLALFDGHRRRKLIRLTKVQSCLQQGPAFRTEDDFWAEHFARGTLVLGHGYG